MSSHLLKDEEAFSSRAVPEKCAQGCLKHGYCEDECQALLSDDMTPVDYEAILAERFLDSVWPLLMGYVQLDAKGGAPGPRTRCDEIGDALTPTTRASSKSAHFKVRRGSASRRAVPWSANTTTTVLSGNEDNDSDNGRHKKENDDCQVPSYHAVRAASEKNSASFAVATQGSPWLRHSVHAGVQACPSRFLVSTRTQTQSAECGRESAAISNARCSNCANGGRKSLKTSRGTNTTSTVDRGVRRTETAPLPYKCSVAVQTDAVAAETTYQKVATELDSPGLFLKSSPCDIVAPSVPEENVFLLFEGLFSGYRAYGHQQQQQPQQQPPLKKSRLSPKPAAPCAYYASLDLSKSPEIEVDFAFGNLKLSSEIELELIRSSPLPPTQPALQTPASSSSYSYAAFSDFFSSTSATPSGLVLNAGAQTPQGRCFGNQSLGLHRFGFKSSNDCVKKNKLDNQGSSKKISSRAVAATGAVAIRESANVDKGDCAVNKQMEEDDAETNVESKKNPSSSPAATYPYLKLSRGDSAQQQKSADFKSNNDGGGITTIVKSSVPELDDEKVFEVTQQGTLGSSNDSKNDGHCVSFNHGISVFETDQEKNERKENEEDDEEAYFIVDRSELPFIYLNLEENNNNSSAGNQA